MDHHTMTVAHFQTLKLLLSCSRDVFDSHDRAHGL